jgi:tRNA pseudouridine38-40 synthase
MYRYQLFFEAGRDPLGERYAWRVWPAADMELVNKVAGLFVGEHDFAAFGAPPRAGSSTVRTITRSAWQQDHRCWTYEVTANAFLYHMVRHLVAAQVAVGQGILTEEHLGQLLERPRDEDGKHHSSQGLADAQGLFLVEVIYPAHRLASE